MNKYILILFSLFFFSLSAGENNFFRYQNQKNSYSQSFGNITSYQEYLAFKEWLRTHKIEETQFIYKNIPSEIAQDLHQSPILKSTFLEKNWDKIGRFSFSLATVAIVGGATAKSLILASGIPLALPDVLLSASTAGVLGSAVILANPWYQKWLSNKGILEKKWGDSNILKVIDEKIKFLSIDAAYSGLLMAAMLSEHLIQDPSFFSVGKALFISLASALALESSIDVLLAHKIQNLKNKFPEKIKIIQFVGDGAAFAIMTTSAIFDMLNFLDIKWATTTLSVIGVSGFIWEIKKIAPAICNRLFKTP